MLRILLILPQLCWLPGGAEKPSVRSAPTTITAFQSAPVASQPASVVSQSASAPPIVLQPAPAGSQPALPNQATHQSGVSLLDTLLSNDDSDITVEQPTHGTTFEPGWWTDYVGRSLRRESQPVSLTLNDLLVRTLQHSKQIKVFSELPLIRETSITEADAAFDWSAFLDSRWDDTSDPVGNALTAGPGINRFRDHQLNFSAGARRRNRVGGSVEISQQFGIQNNNSTFFVPNNQGTSRLVLSYTQPLLRGRGETYNHSLVCLAGIDKTIADAEFLRQLQSHLLEVTRGYWALYLERAAFLQQLNLYTRAKTIVRRLEERRHIDATAVQIKSAAAALAARRADLARSKTAIRNAEARLRSLVNDPELGNFHGVELVPADLPSFTVMRADIHGSICEALQYRPEVAQAIKQVRAAAIRCNMSRHELMPLLNLVTETYVAGLESDSDISAAWGNQFDQGEPGYSIGLQFEIPINNRAARARHQRRNHERRQMQHQYESTLETVNLEVETAAREVNTSQQEIVSKEAAMKARRDQLENVSARWKLLPGENASASLTLENLLSGQEQLANAEYEYLQAQVTYNLSLTNLKRATGTLLQHEQVHLTTYSDQGLPTTFASIATLPESP